MMQVWLVLLGAVLMWRADILRENGHITMAGSVAIVGLGCLIVSIILVFVNGGTTG